MLLWLAAALLPVAPAAADGVGLPDDAPLVFVDGDGAERTLTLGDLRARFGARDVEVADPYHARPVRYRACPLRRVLELGLGGLPADFASAEVLLRARDGYTRPARGALLLEPGGYLAFGEVERLAAGETPFAPIDRRQVDPGPFYLVWEGPGQGDPDVHPWPYQLARVEVFRFEERFPHTLPRTAPPGSAAWRGFALFRDRCIACHAVNGEGGRVGPDLNVPRSIVEYRPEAQIRAYVKDPSAFRYTTMPPHPGLGEADLDDLIAYFRTMSGLKHDPGPGAGAHGAGAGG